MASGPPASTPQMSPEEAVRRVAQARGILVNEVHKVIIGQDQMIEEMLICVFARGHCLTIGVPGLAKTLTISTLARALALDAEQVVIDEFTSVVDRDVAKIASAAVAKT